MVLKTVFSIKAGIVIIQKPFISSQKLCHSGFNFYLLKREKKDIKVITVIKKDFVNKIVVDYKTDIIDYPYFILLEICKLKIYSKRHERKIQGINIYNNWIKRGYMWNNGINRIKRVLENINWKLII